jgi:hypothetical protein
MNKMTSHKITTALSAPLAALSILFCEDSAFSQASTAPTVPAQVESVNQRMTREAWEAYNADRFEDAINRARACVREFRREAETQQSSLRGQEAPPVGPVEDEARRRTIFSRGPLNDVATCYYIQGEANLKLARQPNQTAKDEKVKAAKQAYQAAAKLTFARTWDLGGWFWDPAAKSNDRLQDEEEFRPRRSTP